MSEFSKRGRWITGCKGADIGQPGVIRPRSGYFRSRARARDETDSDRRLEPFSRKHMMFKGRRHRSASRREPRARRIGGQSNAYTSEEQNGLLRGGVAEVPTSVGGFVVGHDASAARCDARFGDRTRPWIVEEIAKYEDQPPFGAFRTG